MTDIDPATSSVDVAEQRRRKSRGVKLFIRDIVLIVVAAVIISVGIKAFLIRSFYIPSGSMQDTLQIDDRIIVNELVPKMVPLQHGDVVVFKDPGGWLVAKPPVQQNGFVAGVDWVLSVVGLSAPDSNDHLVKRVIGLPGDKVACCNAFGQMTVNGIPLVETYNKLPAGVTKVSANDFSVTVPKNSLWVMGDNRYNSEDSRFHANTPTKGFVPMDDVVGRAFLISWPSSHWTWLDNYPNVFSGVTDTGTRK
jgi:signal peptidase I